MVIINLSNAKGEPSPSMTAAVVGSSGFIGSAIAKELEGGGWNVRGISAPRLTWNKDIRPIPQVTPATPDAAVASLASAISGCSVVINAAGISKSTSRNDSALLAANALLPLVLLRACEAAAVPRFIQMSSASVQGDKDVLDSAQALQPQSPYALSKALGESWLVSARNQDLELVIYRPPGVHAPGRRVTELIRVMSSRGLLPVAGNGSSPAPQALLSNVCDAVRFLVESTAPPLVVHHPWEGLSCSEFLCLMGNRDPWRLPPRVAKGVIQTLGLMGRLFPQMAPHRRRLEVLMFGQVIASSWLEEQGWKPPSSMQHRYQSYGS